ncbi:protein kinase [Vitiosangium sp. GDMCC 1.1324]|uniref:protein kinase domain-containing protein n=1 Tax=Vitiosangium sp. (strain GDMCC 1.1324) TaxID=2138576 RepID=UPI000D3D73C3|nr:protein kinase [Vitiosangium sp. GDMCC 1.1324]PTL84903.1 protein kinase [Vitiosangium sp. GDMCC 1.1324]
MRRDAPQEDGQAGPPTRARESSEGMDFGDSFLKEVLRAGPSSRLPVPGQRLGGPEGQRFHILQQMGQGGMGQVFRAQDATLQREVALKFLLPRKGFEELTLAEARAVARLDHENIVRIFDVAQWSPTPGHTQVPFLVMELLEGETLAGLLRRERPGLRRALEILEAIAAGLAHAHERGIVHRDLKPGNVFLTREGSVKLLDFGLSHLAEEPVRSALQLGGGTPAYMAPEQWRGEAQDARTDIWAAGVVLHELLTGEPPFQGASLAELSERVTSPEPAPPIRVRHPEVPRQVDALLATALAKEPARRFSSALELREEVRELRGRLFGAGCEGWRPTAEPQRRQVTLVSCQLAGLAGSGAPFDTEDLGELELAFHEACVEVIERHGGSVALSMGGEVLACFGWMQGREDDSERAVRAGLQLTRGLEEMLQRRLPHLVLAGLSVRSGVHTELMAVGARLQGEAPKVAAWLARWGSSGGVVISDGTWQLVRGSFLAEPLGSQVFEGLLGRVSMEAHQVLRERESASRFERAHVAERLSPLVGRERELGLLLECWAQARRGKGSFVLVNGEAGIGKSRLIEALCERMASESAHLIQVQCWSRFSARELHPIIEMLQKVVGSNLEDPPPLRLEKLEERLRRMGLSQEDTHLLGLLLALPVPEDSPVLQLTPERRKEKTFESLAHVLVHCPCEESPELLVIEDLHWADSTLLELLGFLLERMESARVLIVLSARPEFQPDWPRYVWFHRLVLERLSAGSATSLVREVARGRELPEETVQTLVEKTDGIPLFIEEMTRMVLEGGTAAPIPLTLHELLLARLDMLPSRQKALAQLGAVVGRAFCLHMLAAVSEREDAPLRRDLAGLMDAGLLQEQERYGMPGYQFRHALFQEVAYQSLSRRTRMHHHRRIARVLAEHLPQVVEGAPEVLAYYLTEAGEHAPAIDYWEKAGRLALERQDNAEAMSHLTRALELLPVLADAQLRLQRELELRMALGLSMLQVQRYDVPETERMFARVWELIPRVGEALPRLDLCFWGLFVYCFARSEYSQAKELAERLVDLGRRHGRLGLLNLGHRMNAVLLFCWGRLRESVQELECILGGPEPPLEEYRAIAVNYWIEPRTAALAHGAIVQVFLGQMDASRRWARDALELAERVGHPHTLALTQVCVAVACAIRGDVPEAMELAEKAMALSSERSFVMWHSWAALVRAWALSELGQPHEGLALMRQEFEHWRALGIRAGTPHTPYRLSLLAEVHLKLGQVREALAAVHEGLAWGAMTGDRDVAAELHRLRGECLRRLGRERDARYGFIRAITLAREQGAALFELLATVSLCHLLRDMGRPEAARRMLERACARFAAGGEWTDLQEARALLEELTTATVVPLKESAGSL